MRRRSNTFQSLALCLAVSLLIACASVSRADVNDPYMWSVSTLPEASSIDLRSVSATSRDSVWVAGSSTPAPGEGIVFRHNGEAWSRSLEGVPPLYSISALDAGHVWAVGAAGNIRFFDGTTWRDQSVGGTETLNAVCALDSTHVWAAGQSGKVFFYNGTAWTPASLGAPGSSPSLRSTPGTHGQSVRAAPYSPGTARPGATSPWAGRTSCL